MGWVIWRDETGNDGNERRVYVRRITPNFVSYTLNRADARKWPTKTAAREASKSITGRPGIRPRVGPDADEAPADMPDMTTNDPDEGADDVRQAVRDALRADEAADDGPPIPYT